MHLYRRSFVLQFQSAVKEGQFEGRAEHVATGEIQEFHTIEELLAFVAQFTNEGAPEKE